MATHAARLAPENPVLAWAAARTFFARVIREAIHMRFIDLSGQRFGRLVAIERAPNKGKRTMWRCKCDCGNGVVTEAYRIKNGITSSCGCYHREVSAGIYSTLNRTHGATNTPTHRSWNHMLGRCTNRNHHAWELYGGRGISVCERWLVFENFLEDMGERPPGTSIDRIDTNGNYEPGNCRWADAKTQGANRRGTRAYA